MNRLAGLFIGICVASLVLGVLIANTDFGQWLPEVTHQAVEVDFLFKFMIIASVFVFLLVHVYLLYFALRYRRRRTDDPGALGEPIHGNTQLEIVWSILPAIFLVFLAALCFGIWDEMHTARPHELQVDVIGHQFFWEFRYPQYGKWSDTNDLNVPANTAVLFTETAPASDVLHSFWVPEFRVKQDVVPGYTTTLRVQTRNMTGTYPVICTEFCGIGHSGMVGKVHILSQAAWLNWLHNRQAQAKTAAQQAASKPSPSKPGPTSKGGTAGAVSFSADISPIFQNHCAACHLNGQQMGGLSLASYATLMKGGSSAAGGPVDGPVVVPGSHTASYLWDAVEGVNLKTGARMPLTGPPYLSQSDINKIAQWIDSGAKNN